MIERLCVKELEGEKLGNRLNRVTGAGNQCLGKHDAYQVFLTYILTKNATDLVVASNKQKKEYN